MKETTTSEYDGRLKYYNIYEDIQGKFADALLEGNYRSMFRCLLLDFNQVCMFWPGGLAAMHERIKELRDTMKSIERLEGYGDEASDRALTRQVDDFIQTCTMIENEIQLLRAKHRLLFPMSVDKEPESNEEHADIYELQTFGSITEGEKHIDTYAAVSADYARLDEKTRGVIERQRWLNEYKDADAFFLIAGYNNTGKSTLGHHIHHLWSEGAPDAGRCAFDGEHFAAVLDETMREPIIKDKIAHWDEANLSGRGAMSKYNKDVIDIYWSNRSDHGLHLWCNPSIEYIEKVLVKERVTGIFLIHRGERGRPPKRHFSLITREKLQELWKKEKRLDLDTLEKNAKKYELFRGWFREYNNPPFIKEYLRRKEERNRLKNERLRENHTPDDRLKTGAAAKKLGVTPQTLKKHLKQMDEEGKINLDELQGATGHYRIPDELLPKLKKRMNKKRKMK